MKRPDVGPLSETTLVRAPSTERSKCKTAVLALRRNRAAGDEIFMFRSYLFTGAIQGDHLAAT